MYSSFLQFENNPPDDPTFPEDDKGGLVDMRVEAKSCPLEITYDKVTLRHLQRVLHNPNHDLELAALQQSASIKMNEIRESTLYNIENALREHTILDLDICLQSSHIIIPHDGDAASADKNRSVTVASLGEISVRSKALQPVSDTSGGGGVPKFNLGTLESLKKKMEDGTLKKKIEDQPYDKFDLRLENLQVMVVLPGERWREERGRTESPLFLLKPLTLKVDLDVCMKRNLPDYPFCKASLKVKLIKSLTK